MQVQDSRRSDRGSGVPEMQRSPDQEPGNDPVPVEVPQPEPTPIGDPIPHQEPLKGMLALLAMRVRNRGGARSRVQEDPGRDQSKA